MVEQKPLGIRAGSVYTDVASLASVPLAARQPVLTGRGEVKRVPRRYHLSPESQGDLKNRMVVAGRFISPYGENRLYTKIIDAISGLGENRSHTLAAVYGRFMELSGAESTKRSYGKTMLERFQNRVPRNEKTGLDPLAKFLHNVEVLQRVGGTHPYGFKLAQVGACVDILKGLQGELMIQLRTGIPVGDPVKPVNQHRRKQYKRTVEALTSGVVIS